MLELNKIYCMDCLEGMRRIPTNFVDCVITDIPYNEVNRKSNGIRNFDFGTADSSVFDLQQTLSEMWRVCKGSFYIFCGIGQISEIFNFFKDNNVNGRLIIYEKTNPVPTNGEYTWLSGIESCVFAKKSGATFNGHCKNTVLRFPIAKKTGHQTPKPVELFCELVKVSTNEGDIILDPFIGGGTTAIAARALGRKYIGFEISKEYCDLAIKRLQDTKTLFD